MHTLFIQCMDKHKRVCSCKLPAFHSNRFSNKMVKLVLKHVIKTPQSFALESEQTRIEAEPVTGINRCSEIGNSWQHKSV